jgi:hypothetical protein
MDRQASAWHRPHVGVWIILAMLAAVEMFIAQQLWDKPITWHWRSGGHS